MIAPVLPLTPAIARLLSGGAPSTVTASAVVGGAICIRATHATGAEEFYFDLEQATAFAHELSDALDLAREFLKEGEADG